jgi:hypothetical protein
MMMTNIRLLQVMLNKNRTLDMCVFVIVSLFISPQIHADVTDILVYKGELKFVLPVDQARNSMLIQHRSKTRDILRIVIDHLIVTNMETHKSYRLQDRTAELGNQVDNEGYWITDILYNGLHLTNDSHRVEGRATLYMIRSQRSRNFNVYLRPERNWGPSHSTIDWDRGE